MTGIQINIKFYFEFLPGVYSDSGSVQKAFKLPCKPPFLVVQLLTTTRTVQPLHVVRRIRRCQLFGTWRKSNSEPSNNLLKTMCTTYF